LLKPYDTLSNISYWAACTAKSFDVKLAMLIIISKVYWTRSHLRSSHSSSQLWQCMTL